MTVSLTSKLFLCTNLLVGAANIWLKPKVGLIALIAGTAIGCCMQAYARSVVDAGASGTNRSNEIISASFPKYGVLLLSAAALCLTLSRIGMFRLSGSVQNVIRQNIIPFSTMVLGYYLGKSLMSKDSYYPYQGKDSVCSSQKENSEASVQTPTPKKRLDRSMRESELIARDTIHNSDTVQTLSASSEGRKQLLKHGAKLLGSSLVDVNEAEQVRDTVIQVSSKEIESLDGDNKSTKEEMAQLKANIQRFEQMGQRDAIQYASQERFTHNEVDSKELDQALERYYQTDDVAFKNTIRTMINQINELIETERRFIRPLKAFLEPIYSCKGENGKTLTDNNREKVRINYFQALENKGIINSEQLEYFQTHLAAIIEHSDKQFSHMEMIQRTDPNATAGSLRSCEGANLSQALQLLISYTNPASFYALTQSMNRISGRIEEFYSMIMTLQRSGKDDLSRPFKAAETRLFPDFPARGADNLYITPTQRAPRYVMLFGEIEKSLEKLNMFKTLASIRERRECVQKCTVWANFRLSLQ